MTYDLVIGDRAYSSWSLRGWLLFDAFGIPVKTHLARLYSDELPNMLRDYFPAKTAPTMRTPEGVVVPETIAIAEELATRHPDAGLWPADPKARATARVLAAEMHAGFGALREPLPDEHARQLYRLRPTRRRSGRPETAGSDVGMGAGPDRLQPHGSAVTTPPPTRSTPRSPPASLATTCPSAPAPWPMCRPISPTRPFAAGVPWAWWTCPDQDFYRRDYPRRPWPGPTPLPARAVDGTQSENAACPYSGKPVTHVLELNNRRFGFCNAFCRDKTVADPEAWPKFMAIYQS